MTNVECRGEMRGVPAVGAEMAAGVVEATHAGMLWVGGESRWAFALARRHCAEAWRGSGRATPMICSIYITLILSYREK